LKRFSLTYDALLERRLDELDHLAVLQVIGDQLEDAPVGLDAQGAERDEQRHVDGDVVEVDLQRAPDSGVGVRGELDLGRVRDLVPGVRI
jgi:hypothetical protein